MAEANLPVRVVVGKSGAYWREFEPDGVGLQETYYSMCPVSSDNDPVEVIAVYVHVERAVSEVRRAKRRFEELSRTVPGFRLMAEEVGDRLDRALAALDVARSAAGQAAPAKGDSNV